MYNHPWSSVALFGYGWFTVIFSCCHFILLTGIACSDDIMDVFLDPNIVKVLSNGQARAVNAWVLETLVVLVK